MKFFNFENAVKQNHFVNLNDVKSDWTVSEERDGTTFSQSWKAWIFFLLSIFNRHEMYTKHEIMKNWYL